MGIQRLGIVHGRWCEPNLCELEIVPAEYSSFMAACPHSTQRQTLEGTGEEEKNVYGFS